MGGSDQRVTILMFETQHLRPARAAVAERCHHTSATISSDIRRKSPDLSISFRLTPESYSSSSSSSSSNSNNLAIVVVVVVIVIITSRSVLDAPVHGRAGG